MGPYIITLVGSTKFKKEFEDAMLKLSLEGNIVLTVICFSHADKIVLTEEQKALANRLHFQKISMSHEIFVVNPGGYIGEDGAKEIEFAKNNGKIVRYLVEPE